MLPFLRKVMLCKVSGLVRLFSGERTLRYSHDLHAKKKAPIMSWIVAVRSSVELFCAMRRMMHDGMAFSCFSFGSLVLKERYNRVSMKEISPSSSLVGFGKPFSRKAATT